MSFNVPKYCAFKVTFWSISVKAGLALGQYTNSRGVWLKV